MRSVSDITRVGVETDDERAWAESMGTDYRRAWDTAPSVSAMCMLASSLANGPGFRRFVATLLTVAGGDGSQVETLHAALHHNSPPGRDGALALLMNLPGLDRVESELAMELRARFSYEELNPVSE
jgi:hypothetical protein